MSNSNIGGRKNRNIRDHLFVVNAILHEVKKTKENIDIEIFDVKKCFDKMWSSETANDFYEAGVKDDTFVLISNSNQSCQIAVKTPWGSLTPRTELRNIEMQGGVLTPLKCSVQMDTLGAECLNSLEYSRILYKYKGFLNIPPLEFVDDVLTITKCNTNSIKMNALVQSKVECKKLELSDTKCFKMHVGKNTACCPNLQVNGKEMQSTASEKYLGDVISASCKIDENIQMRHDKGMGIVNSIISILKEISFGRYHFQIGMMLRTSMLVNGMLFSTEALSNLSTSQTNLLEDCDKKFMRQLFDAEQGTPIEAFYIETSAWPFRHIILGRRLMYYWCILQKNETELVRAVFNAQRDFPTDGSWISEVQSDLESCNIRYSEDEIRKMSKMKFKKIVKEKIQLKVMSYLVTLQNKHIKSENLHIKANMQEYLSSEELSLSQKKLLFLLRCKMLKIRANFSSFYNNKISCSLCENLDSEETEEHLLCCPFLLNEEKVKNEIRTVKYSDVFSGVAQQSKVVNVFRKVMEIYEEKNKK